MEAYKVHVAAEHGEVMASRSYSVDKWMELGRQGDMPVWLQWSSC